MQVLLLVEVIGKAIDEIELQEVFLLKQAIILVGGKGTRLKNISKGLPKPMTLVMGKPLLQHIIEQCCKYGFLDIVLLVSYKYEAIEDFFADGRKFGVSIKYCFDKKQRGTAGALLDSFSSLNNQFLIIYGDTFFDIDLDLLWDFHNIKLGDVSIFLHPNDHPQDSDLIDINSNSMVTNIHPYPHDFQWQRNLVNAALYVFSKSSLVNISLKSNKPDIVKDLFPSMLKSGRKLYGYLSTEYIKDIGTPERLDKVETDICSGRVKKLRKQTKKIAIFLDRDGVINKEVDHLSETEQFELIPGVEKAISNINKAGILAVVVTNQPVIARGDLQEDELRVIHNKMDTLLGEQGAYIDRLYYCPHHPDRGFPGEISELKFECDCRKPKIGLFMQAKNELNISLAKSWIIGDSTRDILSAEFAGLQSILVETGNAGRDFKYDVTPKYISKNLSEAVSLILEKIKNDC
mgnify:CR=1 FL=1